MARWVLRYTTPQKRKPLSQYLFLIIVSGVITFFTITYSAPKIHNGIRPLSLLKTDPTVNNTQCSNASMFIKSKDFQQAIQCILLNEDKRNDLDSLKNIPNNNYKLDNENRKGNVPTNTFTNISRCSNEGLCDTRSLNILARQWKVNQANCKAIFTGNKTNIDEGIRQANETKHPLLSNSFYLNLTENCDLFKLTRGYVTCLMTQEEQEFSIAFSILVFKDIEMVERLLRAIYRPQNYYCIHVDAKADKEFFLAVSAIAQCFTNVFLTAERVDVQWGQFSVLEPELICMKQLWRYTKWKYFINLTGQEFPLKTNAQLVKILKAFNGANDIEGVIKRANLDRWPTHPPRGLRPVKGAVHVIVNRDFVNYILHNDTAKDLLEWVKRTGVPDETFFATLNHNPQLGIRGSYKGDPETDEVTKPFNARFKNWGGTIPCAGRFVRGICILTTGDLPLLYDTKKLFANKFYLWEDFLSVGCLEEKLMNDTRDEFLGVKTFNVSYYESLAIVKNRVV
ncbi:beta-1,3-galactosyl-O-glycosyl-glycoprotein beta-1,6-N-acetylglucosaminyltransferase-like [Physella acuta]|uniref:beta-1,3-galactosyl-O-glycosyl-glycoprotein beta-1,6-N-acetylglucosaminyltransferase-like n=1 Tax=Physella acuta TaxID=109671 RepID=UPI0027DC2912|nr:beta-1,3-galactosyl-O-glycosyl-glycoprotein beta-1,6-N-acetylglucosaminyltransferase-like [Physella acuta]